MEALRPAFRFLVGVWAERAPARLLPLLGHWQAVYSAGLFLLEGYHLRYHGATFAEHFFGLQRKVAQPLRRFSALEVVEMERQRLAAPALTKRLQMASLAVAVLLPWLRSKCEEHFRALEASFTPARTVADISWLRVYPCVHAVNVLASFGYRLLYLLERTDVWSPWLHLLGLRLVRHFPEPPLSENLSKDRMARMRELVGSLGSASLWGAVYLMQFLQWWYQREHLLQPFRPCKAPPPPPLRPLYQDGAATLSGAPGNGPRRVLLPEDRRICPLCHRLRRNPAMSCSGYAFCYTCLVPHVQRFGCCPVTGLSMTAEQVRRVRDASEG